MSYILEALQESQRGRDARPVPDLQTVHVVQELEPQRRVPRKVIPWVVMLLCALLAGLAGWWFGGVPTAGREVGIAASPNSTQIERAVKDETVSEEKSEEVIAVEPVNKPVTGLKTTSPPAEPVAIASKLPVQVQPVPDKSAAPSQPAPSVVTRAKDKPFGTVAVAEQPEVAERAQRVEELVANTESVPEPEQRTVAAKKPVDALEEEKSVLADESSGRVATLSTQWKDPAAAVLKDSIGELQLSAPEDEVVGPEEDMAEPEVYIPHFRELPLDIQQQVKDLSFSVHLYSPSPAARMLKIDGIVRREGSEISSGLVLQEITPNGAIFNYQGQPFRMPVR